MPLNSGKDQGLHSVLDTVIEVASVAHGLTPFGLKTIVNSSKPEESAPEDLHFMLGIDCSGVSDNVVKLLADFLESLEVQAIADTGESLDLLRLSATLRSRYCSGLETAEGEDASVDNEPDILFLSEMG